MSFDDHTMSPKNSVPQTEHTKECTHTQFPCSVTTQNTKPMHTSTVTPAKNHSTSFPKPPKPSTNRTHASRQNPPLLVPPPANAPNKKPTTPKPTPQTATTHQPQYFSPARPPHDPDIPMPESSNTQHATNGRTPHVPLSSS